MLRDLLARFAAGRSAGRSVALSAADPSTPRDCSALVREMRSETDPASARGRIAAQQRGRSIYAGAANNRLTEEFLYSLRSPDMELRQELRVLRSRARQLAHDSPWVRKFLLELRRNVIGPQGVRLRARHMTTSSPATPHTTANRAIETGWKDFCRKENAIASRDMTLHEVAGLVLDNLAIDGEVFLHRIRGFANAHSYTLDLIDPDQFDETYFRYAASETDTEVRMGVEIDRWGAAVAYWPWKRHPSEYAGQTRVRIPASDILHIFVRRRPRQTRGETWLAPVLTNLKMYEGYQMSELVAARQNANSGGFIEIDPTKGGQWASATEPNAAEDLNDRGSIEWPGDPGTIPELAPGQTFRPWHAIHPSTAYEPFSRQILTSIAAGIGISYAAQTGDLSRANYSSLREGKLSERDGYEIIQQFFTGHFYEPVYVDWLPMAILARQVTLPTNDTSRWHDVQFIARGWDWVDPYKDLQAASLEVAMGLTSRTRLCAESGDDFEEVLQEQALEQAMQKKYGVELSLDTKLTNTPGAGGSTDENTPTPGGDGGTDGQNADDAALATRVALNGHHRVSLTRIPT